MLFLFKWWWLRKTELEAWIERIIVSMIFELVFFFFFTLIETGGEFESEHNGLKKKTLTTITLHHVHWFYMLLLSVFIQAILNERKIKLITSNT